MSLTISNSAIVRIGPGGDFVRELVCAHTSPNLSTIASPSSGKAPSPLSWTLEGATNLRHFFRRVLQTNKNLTWTTGWTAGWTRPLEQATPAPSAIPAAAQTKTPDATAAALATLAAHQASLAALSHAAAQWLAHWAERSAQSMRTLSRSAQEALATGPARLALAGGATAEWDAESVWDTGDDNAGAHTNRAEGDAPWFTGWAEESAPSAPRGRDAQHAPAQASSLPQTETIQIKFRAGARDRFIALQTHVPTQGLEEAPRGGLASRMSRQERKGVHEPDSQAAQDSPAHPRLARPQGVLPHDAGARRRAAREQGDGLRARRGAHQEERARAGAQQGSLFVDC